MTDFDPDTYLNEAASSQANFDPDEYLKDPQAGKGDLKSQPAEPTYDAALFRKRVGRDPEPAELANFKASKGVGWAGDPTQGKFTVGQAAVGGIEGALSIGSSIPASIAAAPAYVAGLTGVGGTDSLSAARATRKALTYAPRTEAGQATMQGVAQINPGEIVPRLLDVSGHPAAADTVREVEERTGDLLPLVPAARLTTSVGRNFGQRVIGSIKDPEGADIAAQQALNAQASSQSMGAAAAAPNLANISPELRTAVATEAQRTGGIVNPTTLARHVEADSLPVRMKLTEGQASQDPTVLSNEVNSRGANPQIAERFNQQNEQLKQNMQALRDRVGPDVYSANPVEHGDTLIEAYQEKDKAARAQIDQAYDAARKALPANTPVLDAKTLLGKVSSSLEDHWATESAPADIMKRLNAIAEGNGVITAGQFEGLRTRLADLARSSDGNTRYAAHLIRGAVEDADLLPGTEAFKEPFDKARALARERFQAMEADPAYSAAVNETVSPDRFAKRFLIDAPRDDVATMKANLADNPTAQQTMGVATLDHLRRAAGIDDQGNGNFGQARFNNALQALGPKMRSLVDPKTADQLDTLGNVARYAQAQPRGSFVNNSNTFVAQAAAHAANVLEGAANLKTGLPVGTMVRKAIANRAQARATHEALKPGAGLGRLSNMPGVQGP